MLIFEKEYRPSRWCTPLTPALSRQRQVGSLSSRSAWCTGLWGWGWGDEEDEEEEDGDEEDKEDEDEEDEDEEDEEDIDL